MPHTGVNEGFLSASVGCALPNSNQYLGFLKDPTWWTIWQTRQEKIKNEWLFPSASRPPGGGLPAPQGLKKQQHTFPFILKYLKILGFGADFFQVCLKHPLQTPIFQSFAGSRVTPTFEIGKDPSQNSQNFRCFALDYTTWSKSHSQNPSKRAKKSHPASRSWKPGTIACPPPWGRGLLSQQSACFRKP